jgi:hypothetical protein
MNGARMSGSAFDTKSRGVGARLLLQILGVGGSLLFVFLSGFAYLAAEHYPLARFLLGLVFVSAAVLWCRFVIALALNPRHVRCPVCGGDARIEAVGTDADLVCSQCGLRADTTFQHDCMK